MAPLTQEEELLFIRHVHLVSSKIETYGSPSKDRLPMLRTAFPDLYSILEKIQPEEAFEIMERYRVHPFFVADVEIILSPKGKEWVTKGLEMIRRHAEDERIGPTSPRL